MRITGTVMVHVPYKGTAPSLNDLIGGHVDLTFAQLASSAPLHADRKAKILATATLNRLESLPDVPTLSESGVPGAESDTWNAISAPPKTPVPVLQKLNTAINDILQSTRVRTRFEDMGVLPGGGDLQAVRKYVGDERARWGEVIKAAGIGAEQNR
jgi:tripartite-type tricarboxylate transporter receptor subunit TctC